MASRMRVVRTNRLRAALVALGGVAVGLALAACSTGHASKPTTPGATSTAAPSPTTSASSVSGDPIADELNAGEYPPCKSVVGQPTDLVVRGKDSAGHVDLRCYTGASLDADHTGADSAPCDPLDDKSTPVYFWGSSNPSNADQQIYAGKKGGTVVIVPDQSAKYFFQLPGGIASVLLAVGCS
jgi:hypothetical protein